MLEESEAEQVRHIFRRYADLPSLRALDDELERDSHRTKRRPYRDGRIVGGIPFTVGPLAYLLQNRIYGGEVVHKGTSYPGEHEAIIDQNTWDVVQGKLKARGPGLFAGERRTGGSPLIGLLHDGAGRRMTATHAKRGSRRYRYYVTREPSGEEPAWRIGARDIEAIVEDRVKALLLDADRVRRMAIGIDPRQAEAAARTAAQLASAALLPRLLHLGLRHIDLHEDRIDMGIGERELLRTCGISVPDDHDVVIAITAPVTRVRRGSELKLVVPGLGTMPSRAPDPQLVELIAEAFALRETMLATGKPVSVIAAEGGKCRKRMMRLSPLAWLAPDIVEAIFQGSQPATLTHQKLLSK
ncbi:MAG: recombinase family protein, partial [Sphingosinicella sp.]|nr:recombinase family protein [Sphingosinicella sp.]